MARRKTSEGGSIESELNEHSHSGRVLALVISRYGGASCELSLILDLVAQEMARKFTDPRTFAFRKPKP
jgi:type II secretory pathway component PulF